MKVAEEIKRLNDLLEQLKDKYCANCQEWDCDYCVYEMEENDD